MSYHVNAYHSESGPKQDETSGSSKKRHGEIRRHKPFTRRTCPPSRGSIFSKRDLQRAVSPSPRLTPAPRSANLAKRGGGDTHRAMKMNVRRQRKGGGGGLQSWKRRGETDRSTHRDTEFGDRQRHAHSDRERWEGERETKREREREREEGGGGAYSVVACFSHLSIDHASVSRRGKRGREGRDVLSLCMVIVV